MLVRRFVRRPVLSAALAAFALLLAARALADQLAWLDPEDAARAAAALPRGSVFVDWIAHMEDARPVVYRVREVHVERLPDHASVFVHADRLAKGERRKAGLSEPFAFRPAEEGRPRRVDLDLAYVYVRSSDAPGVFVSLAKKLGLACDIAAPAIEVPLSIAGPPPEPAPPRPDATEF